MAFPALYLQELRALGRGRFTFFGLAALFAFVALLGLGFGPEYGARRVYMFFVYLLIPSGFAAFAAVQMASPRSTKFVQAVFTAPVRKSTYFFAKTLVILTIGAGYLAAVTLPFVLVYAVHVGVPADWWKYFAVGVGMILFCTALGMLLGVAFTGRSVAAPVSLSVITIFLAFGIVFMFVVYQSSMSIGLKAIVFRFLHMSPQVNVLESGNELPQLATSDPALQLWVFTAWVAALYLVAAWIYLAHQGVETWEARNAWKPFVAGLLVAAVLLPTLGPAQSYSPAAEGGERAWGESGDGHTAGAILLKRGARPSQSWLSGDRGQPAGLELSMGTATPGDLLAFFPYPEDFQATKATMRARGTNGLTLTGASNVVADPFKPTEFYNSNAGRVAALRVPVTATAESSDGLVGVPFQIRVETQLTFPAPDDQGNLDPQHTEAGVFEFSVIAHLDGARLQMLSVGAVLPLFFLGTAIVRTIRRR